MEAAQAAEAQPMETQVEGESQEAQDAPDIAQWQQSVDQQLSSAADSIRQMAQANEQILSRLPEPEPEPGFEDQISQLFEESGGYPEPQQLQSLINEGIQKGIQSAMEPIQQQLGAFQQQMTAQELAGLQTEFPELADQRAADSLAESVVNTASELGAPAEIAEGLMQNANFVRLVHLAEKAKGRTQQETPAGGTQPPQIETGGGAAPTSTTGDDPWDAIANAGGRKGPIW